MLIKFFSKILSDVLIKVKKISGVHLFDAPSISARRRPTSATKPSMQLDLESGTICRQTSDSRTCHIAVSEKRQRHF